MRPLLSWIAALAACTDASLYSQTGNEPVLPDRLAVSGTLCTEDTGGSTFPVKVLFVIDTSNRMFTADPDSDRISGPPGSVNAILNAVRSQANVRVGFVAVSATSNALPTTDGPQFWRPQDPEVIQATTALQAPLGNARDVVNALSQVQGFILTDIANSSTGEVLRTRYLVSMLFAGPPSPTATPDELSDQVSRMADAIYGRGALEFRLNVGHLYYGPRTLDSGGTDDFACYSPGVSTDPLCTCSASVRGIATYCQAFCDTQNGTIDEAQNTSAEQAYRAMAFAGGGTYRQFGCPSSIDLNVGIAEGSVQLVRKDIVAFNRNVRLDVAGPTPDSDGDGLTDAEEIQSVRPTDPTRADTDGDGISDSLELRTFPQQDPLNAADRPSSCGPVGLNIDRDIDLLNDCEEGLLQTSATIPDTDGDGLPDLLEFLGGTVPTAADDRLLDFDGDGLPNATEVLEHIDPRTADSALRSAEGYRYRVNPLGIQPVADLEIPAQLRGLTFVGASTNVLSGPGYLRWDPCNQTLEAGDVRASPNRPLQLPAYVAVATPIPTSGRYALNADFTLVNATTGETELIDRTTLELDVALELLPRCADTSEVVALPLLTVSPRNCYNVRISNIKLMETLAADGQSPGLNRVLLFFTQAPSDRLASPGITRVAEVRVQYRCVNPSDTSTCRREPADGVVILDDRDFVSALP